MTIGIIVAMDKELDQLRLLLDNATVERKNGFDFIIGDIGDKHIVLQKCGIGKVNSAVGTVEMIGGYHPDLIVSSGCAGGADTQLSVGDVAISSGVVQHDMDTSPLGDPPGLLSGIDKIVLPADEALAGRLAVCAQRLGINTASGVIASGDQFVASAERKAFIVRQFGAIACEMEGAAVGQACYLSGVPFCVLRAISDSADGSSHMDYPAFTRLAAEQSVRLLLAFLRG